MATFYGEKSINFRPFFRLGAILLFFLYTSPSSGCPGILAGAKFGWGVVRNNLRLFVLDSNKQWQEKPVQVDPIGKNGKMKFFPDERWKQQRLARDDKVSFILNDFGARVDSLGSSPCEATRVYEVSTPKGRYGYFFVCKKPTPVPFQPLIKHQRLERSVVAPLYSYGYTAENHLMFDFLKLSFEKPYSFPYLLAAESDQLIIGDLQSFLTLTFDAGDFEAEIINERAGPVALVGQLSFFLQILMFSIDLELSPEVNFYPDSIHVPMVMHLPVDPQDYLNPGSGLYYSWRPGKDLLFSPELSQLPEIGAKPEEVVGQHCQGSRCFFTLSGDVGFGFFSLDFIIDRSMVLRGFFPQLIRDLEAYEKKEDYKYSRYDGKRLAVFFETSRLPEGSNYWDFWLRFGTERHDLEQRCGIDQLLVKQVRK